MRIYPVFALETLSRRRSCFYRLFWYLSGLAMVVMFSSCAWLAPPKWESYPPTLPEPAGSKRIIAIFFDGTSNDDRSSTNTWEMFVRARANAEVHAFYIEGVGAKGKPLGLATAWGMGARVRKAYEYLLQTYRTGDEIHIFGFSRGAFSARVLASLLQHAGLPDRPLSAGGAPAPERVAEVVYDAFKCST